MYIRHVYCKLGRVEYWNITNNNNFKVRMCNIGSGSWKNVFSIRPKGEKEQSAK